MTTGEEPLRSRVAKADFFEQVGYATVWEDERVIDEGLAPRPGETALSITSGGDFSLQLLLAGTAEVHSLDFNPRQSFLLHFKRAAVEALDPDGLWEVLGLVPSSRRSRLYRALRGHLPDEARRYWDGHDREVARGVLLCGKQDRYFHLVGRVLTLLQGRRTVREFFDCRDREGQVRFFDRRWNGPFWRNLGDVFFSRRVLEFFFHKEHFRYAREGEHPGGVIRAQVDRTLRELPARENFYLYWVFHRTYPDRERCPAWLRASNFERLRDALGRLRVHTGELEEFLFRRPDRSIDCYNFSNIFDWVSPEAFAQLMRETVRTARPGARLCYWTNVVNTRRELASAGVPGLVEDAELGRRIHAAGRTPGYSSLTLGRVIGAESVATRGGG